MTAPRDWTRPGGVPGCARDVRQFLRELAREGGWEARRTRGGHVQLRRADGRGPIYTMPGTPSDHRAIRNARAAVQKILSDTTCSV